MTKTKPSLINPFKVDRQNWKNYSETMFGTSHAYTEYISATEDFLTVIKALTNLPDREFKKQVKEICLERKGFARYAKRNMPIL